LGNAPAEYLKVLVRTSGAPAQLLGALRQTIRSLDPKVPIDRAAPFAAWLGDPLAVQRLYTLLLASFAVLALALAATGVYGIAAYAVTRRTREIGIRVTLGAGRAAVLRLIVSHGLALTVMLSLALGIGTDVTMLGLVDSLLFRPPAHVRDVDRLVDIRVRTYPDYVDLRDQTRSFSGVAGWWAPPRPYAITDADHIATVQQMLASASLFPVL